MLAYAVFSFASGAFYAMPLFALAEVVIGASLSIAGVMLWRGHSAMYSVGMFAWGLAAIYAGVTSALMRGLSPYILYLFVGAPVVAFLFRESRQRHAA